MDERERKQREWAKRETVQYALRFMKSTGVPAALEKATQETGETTPEYLKRAIVQRLQKEGFLQTDVVLNFNKQRHKEKLAWLEKYLAQEKQKMK